MEFAVIFFFGLVIGSFFNVLLSRLDKEDGIVAGRSHCPFCHRVLAWHELIPVFSFIALRGRCRTCKRKISWRYPLVELLTATLLVIFFFNHGLSLDLRSAVIIAILLGFLLLAIFDFSYFVLPDKILVPMIVLSIAQAIAWSETSLEYTIGFGLLLASIFGILYVVSDGLWIGFGDVKLAFCIGIFFPFPQAVAIILLSIWIAAIIGIGLLLTRRASLKTALPFGSFLSSISILFILFNEQFFFLTFLFS
ncbi:MAG: prepilin peptidase [Candidatus Yanofskybacteria bacterium]|nr:prepilin peptidase [Candidatus Yanofskybacteria bacterium]